MSRLPKVGDSHLSDQERVFVAEYLVDLKAERAALAAGYSKSVAASKAHQWVAGTAKPHVGEAIRAAIKEREARVFAGADQVLRELVYVAFSDIRKLFDENGRLLKPHEMPEDVARAVESIEVKTQRNMEGDDTENDYVLSTVKVKNYPKLVALEKIGRHLGLFGPARDREPEDALPDPTAIQPESINPRELAQRIAFLLSKGSTAT